MATKLKDLELTEVSCVKAGANPGARILLAKTGDPKFQIGKAGVRYDTEMSLTDRIENVGMAIQEAYRDGGRYYVCIKEIFDDAAIFKVCGEGMMDEEMYRVPYEYGEAGAVTLGERVPVKVVYEDAGATAKSQGVGADKAKPGDGGAPPEVKKGAGMEMTQEVLQAEIQKALSTERAEFDKKLKEVQTDLSKTQETLKSERERADAAELIAKAEREERRLNEFIAVGKSKYSNLPLDEKRKGEILKACADKLSAEENTDLTKMLDSGNAALQRLMVPGGAVTLASASTAEGQLYEMAKTRATERKMEISKALIEVTKENPELYAQARAEKGRAN